MKRMRKIQWGKSVIVAVALFMSCLMLAFFSEGNTLTARAESAAKVTASSANIRKEASASSTALASVVKNNILSVIGQVTGADGEKWYQVYVDANSKGFIMAKLVEITDGSTPKTLEGGATTTTTTTTTTTAPAVADPAGITEVVPTSGKIVNGTSVNVRADASTTAGIVTSAKKNLSITVTGYKKGGDGRTWYYATFIADGKEDTGYIREDFVELAGSLQEPAATPEPEPEPVVPEESYEETTPVAPVVEESPYGVGIVNEKWYLFDYEEGKQYAIDDFLAAGTNNKALYEEELGKNKGQKIVIIILIVLLLLLAGAVAFLIFKLKDSAEDGPAPRRQVPERRPRPDGAPQRRPAPNGAPVRRPRPEGAPAPERRPRPDGAPAPERRPRPEGAPAPERRPRPEGAPAPERRPRPEGAPAPERRPRPEGAPAPERRPRPEGAPAPERRPEPKPPVREDAPKKDNEGWKPKNFAKDDDEFEFEFLNWNGEDED